MEEEKQLVARAQNDPAVFGCLFDENYSKILNYLIRRTGNVELAEDICSETFHKALAKLWQFSWRSIPFSAWLYRIAINELNGYYHKQAKYKAISFETLSAETGFDIPGSSNILNELKEAEEELARHELFLSVRKELVKLPLKYQEVLSLKYFENKKIAEIAVILGKKEGTIKSLISRGLAKLESKLQPSDKNSIIDIAAVKIENI